jgi:beta-galactosidase
VHVLTSLQALAHGADTVQYFQWRKSRGSSEKFHGAVVGHDGTHNTRVFREVSRLGKVLGRLADLAGARVNVEVAVLFDWENRWAIEDAQGPRNDGRRAYEQTVMAHHYPFWARGIATDVIDSQCDFSPYRVIVAPMFYMIKPAVAERLADFVAGGGTFVTTYWSGIVDEHDLCFMGGFPGPLRSLLGIWSEELDSLYPSERVPLEFVAGNPLGMKGRYEAREYCDLIHAESAEVLARYAGEFYTGMPAVTLNRSGNGEAYYLAARSDDQMLEDFYSRLANRVGLRAAIAGSIPVGVSAQVRTKGAREFLFLLNFTPEEKRVSLDHGGYTNLISEQHVENELSLEPYGSAVLVNGQN